MESGLWNQGYGIRDRLAIQSLEIQDLNSEAEIPAWIQDLDSGLGFRTWIQDLDLEPEFWTWV
jgi:hypothetical protein